MKYINRNSKAESDQNSVSFNGEFNQTPKKKFSIKKLLIGLGIVVAVYLVVCIVIALFQTLISDTGKQGTVVVNNNYYSDSEQDKEEDDEEDEAVLKNKSVSQKDSSDSTGYGSYIYSSEFTAPKISKQSYHSVSDDDFSFDHVSQFTDYTDYRSNNAISMYWGEDNGCIKLPTKNSNGSKVTAIDGAFIKCDVEGVLIPSCINFIEDDTFKGCENLKYVEFEGKLETLGGAFDECTALENIILPDGIKTVNSYTFTECRSLNYVKIPSTVKKIKENAIILCGDEVYVYVPKSVEDIDEDAFGDEVIMVVEKGSYAEEYAKNREEDIIKRKGNKSGGSSDNSGGNAVVVYPDTERPYMKCSKCNGTGSFLCPSCDGLGSHYSTKNTPGYGYGSGGSYTVETRCAACGGNGSVNCYACGGDGDVNN